MPTSKPLPESPVLPATRLESAAVQQLGHYSLPERTIEHDFAVQERYQAFSAELLRISLLGLGVIGVGAAKILFPEGPTAFDLTAPVRLGVVASLAGFAMSAGAALVHRYASVDSLSWHIQSLRRDVRDADGDAEQAEKERRLRYQQFVRARNALRVSATSLGFAAVTLAFALIVSM
jgi:hypothetical protein